MNRNFFPNTTDSVKKDKDQSLISLIRRQDAEIEVRPFTAYNKQSHEFRFNSTSKFPKTAYGSDHFKTKSSGLLKRSMQILLFS